MLTTSTSSSSPQAQLRLSGAQPEGRVLLNTKYCSAENWSNGCSVRHVVMLSCKSCSGKKTKALPEKFAGHSAEAGVRAGHAEKS